MASMSRIKPMCAKRNNANGAGAEALDTTGQFVVDIAGGHHRYGPLGTKRLAKSLANLPWPFLVELLLASLRGFAGKLHSL